MTSARRVALTALKTWRTEKQFADSIISRLLNASLLKEADRGFALELFYGVLRNRTLLDFWISQLRQGRLDANLRDILRLGAYQLFFLETSPHAAVHETVELAASQGRGIANAILRNASRNRDQLQRRANQQPLSVQWSHPEFLIERWQQNFGDAPTLDLCAWNNRPAPVYARINQLKITPAKFVRTYAGSFLLPNQENFAGISAGIIEAVAAGHCYIQDPSTALACDLLDPQPGERILDACAAPGGKTGYLAEKMQNRGAVLACDRDRDRLKILRENLARVGVEIADIWEHDWEKTNPPGKHCSTAPFDRILIDAPCSNTGVIRRRVDVRWRLRPGDFLRMQQRQLKIIRAVAPLLKPDGILVYSTCSIEPEENELVAEQVASTVPFLRRERQEQLLPFRDHVDGAFAARFVRMTS